MGFPDVPHVVGFPDVPHVMGFPDVPHVAGFPDVPRCTVTQCVVGVDDRSLRMLDGRSCLGWLLREFIRFGVTDFLLLADRMPADPQPSLPRQVRITMSPPHAGSGGALFAIRDQLQDRFLLCDGASLFDWNLATLLADGATDQPEGIGRVLLRDRMAGGIGLFRKTLETHPRPVGSREAGVRPGLAERGLLGITRIANRAAGGMGDDVSRLRRKALFLDRDGVLNVDHGYVGSHDRLEWVDGALEAIRYATDAGWHVFIVTNQSGVARGLYTEDAVRTLLDWMADRARAAGGTIDDVRFCPFHPEAPLDAYRRDHPWRKPLPGMLLDLIRAWEVDPRRAVMIGDQETDMRAAAAAGVAGHLFPGGNLLGFLRPILDRHA